MEKQIMWAVYGSNEIKIYTLDYQRKGAISKFMGNGRMTWEECKPYGYTVKKVEVTIKPKQ